MSSVRQSYESLAVSWDKAGRPAELLELSSWAILQIHCWMDSEGAYNDNQKTPILMLVDFWNASAAALEETPPYWFDELMGKRDYCERCAAGYRIENLSLCAGTDCHSLYCIDCAPRFRKGRNGNRRCDCGGEIVG